MSVRLGSASALVVFFLLLILVPNPARAMIMVCSVRHPSVCTTGDGGSCNNEPDVLVCNLYPEPSEGVPRYTDSNAGRGLGGGRSERGVKNEFVKTVGPNTGCHTNHPVVIATGNKILPELDFMVDSEEPAINVSRFYDRRLGVSGSFGRYWSVGFEYGLTFEYGKIQCRGQLGGITSCNSNGQALTGVYVLRPSGVTLHLNLGADGTWRTADADVSVQQVGANWKLRKV